jgi:hypothetical protein
MKDSERIMGGIAKPRYAMLHKRIIKSNGSATKCENPECPNNNSKRYEWALKKGHEYSDNPDDYIQLCPSCHRKYDMTDEVLKKHRERLIGETHNAAKLTNDDVLMIYEMLNIGVSSKEIAAKFSMHPTTISDIKRGKRWPHLFKMNQTKTSISPSTKSEK